MTRLIDDGMLNECWTLSPSVALRPEPFGALAYHFGNRRLTFLKNPRVVSIVRGLGASATVRDALIRAEVAEDQWPIYLNALRALADSDMLCPKEGITHDVA